MFYEGGEPMNSNNTEQKNKFKTEFLSNVAYDIKKPINKIYFTPILF